MQVNIFDGTARKAATYAIAGYQKYISPHKGFSCAYRLLHGGESCSNYFKRVIGEEGLITAIQVAEQRFQDCRTANEILRARRKARCEIIAARSTSQLPEDEESDRSIQDEESERTDVAGNNSVGSSKSPTGLKNNESNNCNNCVDCADALSVVPDCSGLDCADLNCPDFNVSDLNCADMDCASFDCSGLDCSGLDCGGLDCGGCG